MKIGAICSAGGSAFFNAVDILVKSNTYTYNDFFLVTDRVCMAEKESEARGIRCKRIIQVDNAKFSQEAAKYFISKNCNMVILFYSRLVTADLFCKIASFNIHPSLLPCYKGFDALGRAKRDGAKFLGATLHLISDVADSGMIVSQVVCPISSSISEDYVSKYSYIQKVYLAVCVVDFMKSRAIKVNLKNSSFTWKTKMPSTWTSNPAIANINLKKIFNEFQEMQNHEVILS